MKRETLIEEITSNSALTEAALTERCDDGLEAIHDDIMSNNDDGGQSANDDEYVTRDELDEALDGLADDVAERVSANAADETKQELAREIVANSAEYEDADTVREDYPTEAALQTKRDQVATDQTVPSAGTGLGANADFGSGDDEASQIAEEYDLGLGGDV